MSYFSREAGRGLSELEGLYSTPYLPSVGGIMGSNGLALARAG